MEARQISYFLAVVDHGGVGRAAAALEIAQPTLSQSIKALERQLGVVLFHRVAHGMVLSPAGSAFVGPARQLVRDLGAARAAVGNDAPATVLDLVAVAPLAVFPGAALVGSFTAAHPDVLVRLDKPDDDDALPGMVRDGSSELGLCYLPLRRLGLRTRELGVHELCLAFPPDATPPPDPVTLHSLAGVDLVGMPGGSWQRYLVEEALRAAGVRTRLVAELTQRDAIVALVLGGVGAAFLVADAGEHAARRGALVRRLDPPLGRRYGLIHRDEPLSPTAAAFHRYAIHQQAIHRQAIQRHGMAGHART